MNSQHTFAILAYKESPYLQACIDSLKKQVVSSEIILCTSTPSVFLEKIATENNLQLFINPKKSGIASDWNFSLKTATTKYVTLAHQDDIYLSRYTQEVLETAKRKKDALIIFSDYDEIVSDGQKTFMRRNSLNFFVKKALLKLFSGNKKRLLIFGNPIGCPTVTFNTETIGDFQFDRNFSINMDWKAWFDLAQKAGEFVWIEETLVSHRIYTGSETTQGIADNRRQNEDRKIFEMFWFPFFASILAKIYSLSYKNNNN